MNGKNWKEAVRFAVTGGVCFLVEFAFLVAFREGLGMDTLLAVPLAFLISVAVNYLICVKWVWPDAGTKKGSAVKLGFLVTSLIGLALNEGLMLLFRWMFGEEQIVLRLLDQGVSMYMLNKAAATLLVMVWNFFTKKAMLRTELLSGLLRKPHKEK